MTNNNILTPKCKYCYDKGWYSKFEQEVGRHYTGKPEIKHYPCQKCPNKVRRKVKL